VIWSKIIGRQSLMAILVKLNNTAKIINILSLILNSKGLFKVVKRNGGIIIIINKSAVSKNDLQSLSRGKINIPDVD
jgi:hypothetical protein